MILDRRAESERKNRTKQAVAFASAAIAAAVLAAVVFSGCRAQPGVTQAPSLASPSASSSALQGSPDPSPTSPGTVGGETPGPSATVPPGTPTLPRIDIGQLAQAAAAAGLECQSASGGPPGETGSFTLGCEGNNAANGYSYRITAPYWTFDAVSDYQITALPVAGGADPLAGAKWVSGITTIPFAEDQKTMVIDWIAQHVAAAECASSPCDQSFGAVTVVVEGGSDGAFTIIVKPIG